jgi:DinB family protein
VSHDWHEWHRAYDRPDSPLSARLGIVQGYIRNALDAAQPGPIQVVSMCAGEARDILGVLVDHPRRDDVHGRLVELDPDLVEVARSNAPPKIEVLCADAGISNAYEDEVPADLVLVCGVFGNIPDDDMFDLASKLPMLCAPGATVVWTRHRRPPDATPELRRRFTAAGFEEVAFSGPENAVFGVASFRFVGEPEPFRPHVRLFTFVGFDEIADACPTCGFSYDIDRVTALAWLPSDVGAFVARFRTLDDETVRRRPAPDVWSPLEYACHVRDVLRVQLERIRLAAVEHEPEFTPMRREERAVEERYNEQDAATVASEIEEAGEALRAHLATLDTEGWSRQGVYNYPEAQLRTVEWITIHTVHELLHHRIDIGTLA